MKYEDFLKRLVSQGIEAARRDYGGKDRHRDAMLAGSIEGFMECEDLQPDEIADLLQDAGRRTREARTRAELGETKRDDYWRARCRELEIEWVANCVSVILVNDGHEPIIPPTGRAAMTVARIVGVGEDDF